MSKFKSTRLGKEIELECTILGNGTCVIDSWSLQQFFVTNEDVLALGAKLGKPVVDYVTSSAATYLVEITDNAGVSIWAVGEANGRNLDSKISGDYPHTMALKRAKDRAIIEYLGLNGGNGKRAYSDNEIIDGKLSSEDAQKFMYASEDIANEDLPDFLQEAKMSPEDEARLTELLGYKAKIGKKKNITVEKILLDDGFVDWLINEESFTNPLYDELKNVVIEVKKLRGEI